MFGVRIALLRAGKGWTQAELAKRIGVSVSAVGMYEHGRREPSLDLVVRLAQEFSVTTDFLLMGDLLYPHFAPGPQMPMSVRAEALIRLLTHTMP